MLSNSANPFATQPKRRNFSVAPTLTMPLKTYPGGTPIDSAIYALKIVGDLPTEEEAKTWCDKAGPDQIILVICEDRKIAEFEELFQFGRAVLCGDDYKQFLYNSQEALDEFGHDAFKVWFQKAEAARNGAMESNGEPAPTEAGGK